MILTLEVTGPQAAKLGAACRKVFRSTGGSIGRLAQNHWALPDPYVSSRHALIRYQDGEFTIEDTSTNGIFINTPDNRLVKGTAHTLTSGDWIFIEPYEIKASITSDSHADDPAGSFDDLFQSTDGPAPESGLDYGAVAFEQGHPYGGSAGDAPLDDPLAASNGEVDPLALLGFERRPSAPPPPRPDLARGSVLSDQYRPPSVAPAGPPDGRPLEGLIPNDWLSTGERPRGSGLIDAPASPAPAPASERPSPPSDLPSPFAGRRPPRPGPAASPAPAPPAARAVATPFDLAEMLEAAGLRNVDVTPELARSFGRILRVVVAGVMDVLQARQTIKNEFRIGVTVFKPADNNPLKFSANVDDALHNLLVKRNAAYLGPVEAFEDAFADIRHHQMAMLEGVRVAFEAMLAEFDPERLQQEFDRRSKGALLSVPARLRYWDQYSEKIHDMVKDADATFRELFGNEFANAYEAQLKRLRSQGRTP